nr:reverse transcriptase domain-containing protein [Tanacetum cinerariifolium]
MRTRSSSNPVGESSPNPTTSNPKLRNRRRSKKPFIPEESLLDMMSDQRTMAELLRAPIEGYEEAIVVPSILAEHLELKHSLINMMTSDQFFGLKKDNPHDHIRAARRWLEKEPPRSILTWEDLAWDSYKDLLRVYPHHGFTELHQLDTFYNALNLADQDSLNSAPSGNLLERRTQDVLTIIENKSKEDELPDETLTDSKLAEYTIKVPPLLVQKAKPHSLRNFMVHQKEPLHPNIPYPLRMYKEKQQDKDEIQIHKFCELKCKALADLGASINLMPLSVWKKLGLPQLISTRMTLELANRAICTPAGIARDVFVLVRKFTFPADFVIVDCESDPRILLILGRPFLRTARALIDVYREEMIIRDSDERLTLNMRHDTSSYSNQPHRESDNMINIYNDSYEDYLEDFGNTTSSSLDHLLEEFADELALITFPPRNDDLPFDIESDLREIEYFLNHDPTKEMDFILEDSVDECNLVDPNNDLVDIIPEMFTDEHTIDYSSPPLYDDVNDDLVELESDNDDVYDDPFNSKEDKIKESKLLIDELDPLRSSDFLPSPECDSVLYKDFSEVDALPSTNNEDKVLIRISISNASLILKDFNHPLYELPFHKEVLGSETLLSFSSENEEKVFNPGILTSKGVHTSLLPKLSHRGSKAFKVIKLFESPMEILPFSYGDDICILDVSCLHFYPP